MSCPLGDKKGRSADSSDLTRLHRETADLAAYISYTELDDNKKLKEQISEDSNFSLTRGGLTLLANSTIGFTRNPVTGEIVYRPYSGQRTSSPPPTSSPIWVAGGSGINTLAYSVNGITWEPSLNGTSIINNTYAVAWNGTLWVAGGSGTNTLAYSYDGITWEPSSNGGTIFNEVRALAWNGTMWVAGGGSYEGITSAKLAYSYDGTTWYSSSNGNTLFDQMVQGIGSSSTLWVAVGYSTANRITYSYDGITWIGSPSGNALFNGTRIARWNGTIWVAGGNGANKIAYSYDGINWTASPSGNSLFQGGEEVWALAWNGTLWVAGGGGYDPGKQRLIYSYDGINWEPSDNGDSSLFLIFVLSVAWDATMSRWVAGGQGTNTLAFSSDGITWTASSNGNDLFDSVNTVAAK